MTPRQVKQEVDEVSKNMSLTARWALYTLVTVVYLALTIMPFGFILLGLAYVERKRRLSSNKMDRNKMGIVRPKPTTLDRSSGNC